MTVVILRDFTALKKKKKTNIHDVVYIASDLFFNFMTVFVFDLVKKIHLSFFISFF